MYAALLDSRVMKRDALRSKIILYVPDGYSSCLGVYTTNEDLVAAAITQLCEIYVHFRLCA